MGKEDSKYKTIRLNWNIYRFVPISSNVENHQTICEILDSKDFCNKSAIQNYWSVPEKLVDMRWLLDSTDGDLDGQARQNENTFFKYMELEYGFYCIIATLGSWLSDYTKIIEHLKRFQKKENTLKEYWEGNRELFIECIRQLTNGELSDDEAITQILEPLYKAAKKMYSLPIANYHKKSLKVSAKQFCKKFEENKFYLLGNSFLAEKELVFELATDFSNKNIDFFTNFLWRKDEWAIKKLKQLVAKIKRILPQWTPADSEEWSKEYICSIWEGLQTAATSICNHINHSQPENPMSLEKMLECVKKEMEKLDLKHSESHFKKYAQDKKRCVALLQAGKKRIMSFSGFWDCEDDEARNVLNGQFYVDVIEAFHNISQACQAKLAILSSEVVDDIIRYELDSKCQLVQKGPLRDELTSVKLSLIHI